jgi:chemotaxis protein methyltransferase WspC
MGVLKRLLRAAGVLFVAPAETALPSSHDFVSVKIPLSFAFRRRTAHRSGAARVSRPGAPPPPRAVATPPLRTSRPMPFQRALPAKAAAPAAPPAVAGASLLADATRLADEGHFVEAATCCTDHMRVHGPSAEAFYLLGLVRGATGNPGEAVAFYRKALYLDPNHYEAQVHLALLMEEQGDAAGALVLKNRARRIAQRLKGSHG